MKAGDRIRLIQMGEDPDPIPPGATGTILSIVDFHPDQKHLNMHWDIKRSLNLIVPPDVIEIIGEADEAR